MPPQKKLTELVRDLGTTTPALPSVGSGEAVNLRFETPGLKIQKFTGRLFALETKEWPHDLEIGEPFCGLGNGLYTLERLGFNRVEGVELSPGLLAQYSGSARRIQADSRNLPLADRSKDALIVKGGLHHPPRLPDDVEKTLAEIYRVLRPSGRPVIVEPWSTRFLAGVHVACEMLVRRRFGNKLDALATMIEFKRETYGARLRRPHLIRNLVHSRFTPIRDRCAWGKWNFVGRPA